MGWGDVNGDTEMVGVSLFGPHASLRILRVASTAPGGDNQRRQVVRLEGKGWSRQAKVVVSSPGG